MSKKTNEQQQSGKSDSSETPTIVWVFLFILILNLGLSCILAFKVLSVSQELEDLRAIKLEVNQLRQNLLANGNPKQQNSLLAKTLLKHQQVINSQQSLITQIVDQMHKNHLEDEKNKNGSSNQFYKKFATNVEETYENIKEAKILQRGYELVGKAAGTIKESVSDLGNYASKSKVDQKAKNAFKKTKDYVSEKVSDMKLGEKKEKLVEAAKNTWEESKKKWNSFFSKSDNQKQTNL